MLIGDMDSDELEAKSIEYRICNVCDKPMVDGYTDGGCFYSHEACFENAMNAEFPDGWREVEDDGYDGYYKYYDRSSRR